jgi:hypothetical protein
MAYFFILGHLGKETWVVLCLHTYCTEGNIFVSPIVGCGAVCFFGNGQCGCSLAFCMFKFVGAFHGNASRYPSNSPINNFHGNQLSQQYMNCCEQCLHLAPPQGINRDIRKDASVSHEDASDQLTRTVPAVQVACSCGTFCKLQCNQRWEQVGEDFSGNQLDQLTLWLIGLH